MARTQAQMEKDLAHLIPELRAVVHGAIAQYVEKYRDTRHEHTDRARAILISDLMHVEVEKRFASTAGVRVIRKHTTIYLGLLGQYLAKFKKLSKSMQTCCTGTQTAIRFADQGAQMGLSPFPEDPTSLFIGYVLDASELTKSSAWIVCPNGRQEPHWASAMPVPQTNVVPLRPAAQPAAADGRRQRRAKPRAKPGSGMRLVKNDKPKKKDDTNGA